jgi:hypothetical protein
MHNTVPSLKEKQDYTAFTVCNLAYLPKALVLAESVFKYNSIQLKVFLFDEKVENLFNAAADFIWVEEMNIPDFKQLAFKYDIIEFSTSLKPYITLQLLRDYKKVIFFDPDICLYTDVTSILRELDHHSIILTPHYTTPQSDNCSESDVGMMRFGSFNLGFYAVKDSVQGSYFLNWWSKRCIDFCYMESQFGLSTDQKWVTIAPCFFEDLYTSFNLGYNVAPWNSWERKITKNAEGNYIVNETFPLVFFHFSNFDNSDPEYLNKRSYYEKNVKRSDFLELGVNYAQALATKDNSSIDTRYAYDYMSDGKYISPTLRRAYACILPELPVGHDPFDSEGVVAKFAKRNYLFEKSGSYKREGFSHVSEHKSQLAIIYFLMRLLLRFVGPNKFMNLSRLLVYLSSYRQNRELWKY